MGVHDDYYIGYHVKVQISDTKEETLYLRKHCSNNSCEEYNKTLNGFFCTVCGSTTMESITSTVKTVRGRLPDTFIALNNDRFQTFRHDDGNSIFLLPNLFSEQEKFGPMTKEFRNGGITSIIVHGYFAEKFDEFREYYAPFLKALDDAGMKYSVDYGLVKYYY